MQTPAHPLPRTVTLDEVEEFARYLEGPGRRNWRALRPQSGLVLLDDDDGDDADKDDDKDDDDGDGDDDDDDDAGDGDDSDEGDSEAEKRAKAAEARAKAAEKKAAEQAKARRKAERALAQKTRQEQEASGEYKEMYEESQRENADLKRQIRDGAFERAVTKVATAKKFRNPSLAADLLPKDLRDNAVDEDGEVDEKLVERELKKLADREPYLTEEEKERQTSDVRGDRDQRRSGGRDDTYKFDPRGKMRDARRETAGSRGG